MSHVFNTNYCPSHVSFRRRWQVVSCCRRSHLDLGTVCLGTTPWRPYWRSSEHVWIDVCFSSLFIITVRLSRCDCHSSFWTFWSFNQFISKESIEHEYQITFYITLFLPYFLICLFSFLLVYFLTILLLPGQCRDPFRFQAVGRRRRSNLALGFVLILCCSLLFTVNACFCCVWFSFSVLSQKIYWEERLRNDLFCVGLDVKPELNQLIERLF